MLKSRHAQGPGPEGTPRRSRLGDSQLADSYFGQSPN